MRLPVRLQLLYSTASAIESEVASRLLHVLSFSDGLSDPAQGDESVSVGWIATVAQPPKRPTTVGVVCDGVAKAFGKRRVVRDCRQRAA